MRALALLPLALSLAACVSGPQTPRMPIVDMTGVDVGRHSRDEAACEQERFQTSFSVGNPLTNCMERKGYKVLARN